jgi:hypothetical protein
VSQVFQSVSWFGSGLDGWRWVFDSCWSIKLLFGSHCVQTGFVAHPACQMHTAYPFPRDRWRRAAKNWPTFTVEVSECLEIYSHSPFTPFVALSLTGHLTVPTFVTRKQGHSHSAVWYAVWSRTLSAHAASSLWSQSIQAEQNRLGNVALIWARDTACSLQR